MEDLPDSLILQILSHLPYDDVSRVGLTSTRHHRICGDELLWRSLFHRHFRVDPALFLEPSYYSSWRAEFKRLIDETPVVETEVLSRHTDQVLHVSFSHDGKRFATSAKDGFIVVWKNEGHPAVEEYSKNMKYFSWKYTQFSQFNESDTLLLVSGVLFGQNSTSGEMCVFSLKGGFQLQCRVMSKPYDIFGTWFSDRFFLSGQHQWLGNMVSRSVIWLNKASQESQSEHAAVMNELFRFYNPRASSVRSLMIANCIPKDDDEEDETETTPSEARVSQDLNVETRGESKAGNPLSSLQLEQGAAPVASSSSSSFGLENIVANIQYSQAFRNNGKELHHSSSSSSDSNVKASAGGDSIHSSMEDLLLVTSSGSEEEEASSREASVEEDHILDTRDKWLIFTCSSETYTPHRIGFKKIRPMTFHGRIPQGPSLRERIEEYQRRRAAEGEEGGGEGDGEENNVNWANYSAVAHHFDKIDHMIDLHGHIIGMALSPDHRYLYVNIRPWPTGYRITNPLDPPPIASEIDLRVIDLKTLTEVGMMRRAHRAYTPNEECFFIFLDTCDQFVASGAEDKHGYVWDRQYGISLVKLPHTDVVNSVAFNPRSCHMLITVSDDNTIKIWRSRGQCRKLGLDASKLNKGVVLCNLKKQSDSSGASSSSNNQ